MRASLQGGSVSRDRARALFPMEAARLMRVFDLLSGALPARLACEARVDAGASARRKVAVCSPTLLQLHLRCLGCRFVEAEPGAIAGAMRPWSYPAAPSTDFASHLLCLLIVQGMSSLRRGRPRGMRGTAVGPRSQIR